MLGANGAGKSTLLRTISGLIRPRAGAVLLEGVAIERLVPSRIVRLGIAHCPEGRRVFGSLSVGENLRLGAAARADRGSVGATASGSSPCSRCCASASISRPAPSRAASSRCWRWRGR